MKTHHFSLSVAPPTPTSQAHVDPLVEPTHDAIQPTLVTSHHDVPTEEVHRDATRRIIIRPVGKWYVQNAFYIL